MDRAEWIGFVTLLRKEIGRFWKVKSQTILSPMINSGLYLLVFGVSLSKMLDSQKGVSYLAFLVPGLMALSSLNNALQNSASSIMISKFHGDLQDLKVIPLSPYLIGIAYSLACLIRGVLVGGIVLMMGELFHWMVFDQWISIVHPLRLLLFVSVGCLFFGNLGIWVGFVSKSFDQINTFTSFIVLPLIYLGGVFFSLEVLHPIWQKLAHFNPLLYFINGIRWSIIGTSDLDPSFCLGISLTFASASIIFAWYSVRFGSYQRF